MAEGRNQSKDRGEDDMNSKSSTLTDKFRALSPSLCLGGLMALGLAAPASQTAHDNQPVTGKALSMPDGALVLLPSAQVTGRFEMENYATFWVQSGQLHRTQGPAIEYADNSRATEWKGKKLWYVEGSPVSPQTSSEARKYPAKYLR